MRSEQGAAYTTMWHDQLMHAVTTLVRPSGRPGRTHGEMRMWCAQRGITDPPVVFCCAVALRLLRKGYEPTGEKVTISSVIAEMSVRTKGVPMMLGQLYAAAWDTENLFFDKMADRVVHYWHGAVLPNLFVLMELLRFDGDRDGGYYDQICKLVSDAYEVRRLMDGVINES